MGIIVRRVMKFLTHRYKIRYSILTLGNKITAAPDIRSRYGQPRSGMKVCYCGSSNFVKFLLFKLQIAISDEFTQSFSYLHN